MYTLNKLNKRTKEEKEKAATRAGWWERKLSNLDGCKYFEVWNRMLPEAVAREIDDKRGRNVFTLADDSTLKSCERILVNGIREVLLPQEAAVQRFLFNWRLIGTRRVWSGRKRCMPEDILAVKPAAKRAGISLADLRRLCREDKLTNLSGGDFSNGWFQVNELDFYRKRHPVPGKA
jgi:hypothetical protein